LKISNGSATIVLINLKSLFNEKILAEYNSRYSTKGSLSEINQLFKNNDWTITVYKQNIISNYNTPKDTRKKIDKLRDRIFILF